jgi:hypothetical protein
MQKQIAVIEGRIEEPVLIDKLASGMYIIKLASDIETQVIPFTVK